MYGINFGVTSKSETLLVEVMLSDAILYMPILSSPNGLNW